MLLIEMDFNGLSILIVYFFGVINDVFNIIFLVGFFLYDIIIFVKC